MKKVKLALYVFLLIFTFAGCNTTSSIKDEGKKLKVYTSVYPIFDFASKICGDKAEVVCLIPGGAEPHEWEPSANDIIRLENADVFIYNGAGMEHWTEKVLGTISNKNLITLDASKGLELLEGHEDEGFDPHVWLSVKNAAKQAEKIKDTLSLADSKNSEHYNNNFIGFARRLEELDKAYSEALGSAEKKDIVVTHEAFGYLCRDYGLNQIGIEGLAPYSEPEPSKMAEVIEFVKANNVTTIFFENAASPKVAQTIARATGAKVSVLQTLGMLTSDQLAGGSDYISVMEQNLIALKDALQ